MHTCPKCDRPVDLDRKTRVGSTCPNCGEPVQQDQDREWIDVARVTNLAEAGFLTDELVGSGIDARIHQLEEFSAVSDNLATRYLIRVPAEEAHDAAERIRQHMAEVSADNNGQPAAFGFTSVGQPMDLLRWRPVALVILAGVASFVLGQEFSARKQVNVERGQLRNSLSTALGEIGRPLATEPAAGEPRHRLSFSERHEAWFLDADRDGDGRYDSRRAFHASGAAW